MIILAITDSISLFFYVLICPFFKFSLQIYENRPTKESNYEKLTFIFVWLLYSETFYYL